MSLESMKCPECDAPLRFDNEDQEFCFCSHCGAQVFKNGQNKKITYRTIDEARIKEIELQELELRFKVKKQKTILIIGISILLITVGIIAFLYFKHGTKVFESLGLLFIFVVEMFALVKIARRK